MAKLAAVILAAGSGTRMGGAAKALLPYAGAGAGPAGGAAGQTFLARIAETARAVGLADGVVVVGPPYGDAVAEHARALGLRVAVNGEPERGMASSIAIGFAAMIGSSGGGGGDGHGDAGAGADVDAAWLWPVDHPDVRAESLARIAEALGERLGEYDVARPRFEGRGGHPPLIARALWPRLAACAELPGGARAVLAGDGVRVIDVPLDDAGVVRDVDTREDAERRRPPRPAAAGGGA